MHKKDYLDWEVSDEFPMEELRSKFNRMLPFAHGNHENYVHASNRLFWLVTESAKQNGLVGRRGIPTIRKEISVNELLYDILVVASPISLLCPDMGYYMMAPPEHSNALSPSFLAGLLHEMDVPKIVWVRDNIDKPTTLTCRIFNTAQQQDLFVVPIVVNNDGLYQLDL